MATSHSNNGAIGTSNNTSSADHSGNNMETNQFHPQHQLHPQHSQQQQNQYHENFRENDFTKKQHQNLSTRLNIDPGLQQQSNSLPIHALSHQQHSHQQQLPSPNYQQPTPWTISEGNSHCVHVFDKLRVQREQSRFADLILSVRGREFAAHRCVMAACSPWFDARLKVHKSTREHINIEQCNDYEIFYALLTYCYTGNIVLDQHNVPELLSLAVLFQMVKLKSYCCEYLCRNLNAKNVHTAVELAIRLNLGDLMRRSFSFLQRSFGYLFENDREELMQYSTQMVQTFLPEKGWSIHPELVLRFVANWVNYDLTNREECFPSLLYCVNWSSINPGFVCEHLDKEQLYQSSQDALFTILSVTDRNNVYLGQKFHDLYQSLQERILPEQELDELNDSNSFLSMAINSAVKDLEQSEVDTDFFLHNDPFKPPAPSVHEGSTSHSIMGPPPPPPAAPPSLPGPPALPNSSSLIQHPMHHHNHHHHQNSYSMMGGGQTSSSNSNMAPISSVNQTSSGSAGSSANNNKPERMEKLKDSLDFEIVEQLIIEQQQSEDQNKSNNKNSVKRYDPKYRALTEAFRQMEDEDHQHNNQSSSSNTSPRKMNYSSAQQQQQNQFQENFRENDFTKNKNATNQNKQQHQNHQLQQQQQEQPQQQQQQHFQYPLHPKQRHLSNEYQFKSYYQQHTNRKSAILNSFDSKSEFESRTGSVTRDGMHNMPQRVSYDTGKLAVTTPTTPTNSNLNPNSNSNSNMNEENTSTSTNNTITNEKVEQNQNPENQQNNQQTTPPTSSSSWSASEQQHTNRKSAILNSFDSKNEIASRTGSSPKRCVSNDDNNKQEMTEEVTEELSPDTDAGGGDDRDDDDPPPPSPIPEPEIIDKDNDPPLLLVEEPVNPPPSTTPQPKPSSNTELQDLNTSSSSPLESVSNAAPVIRNTNSKHEPEVVNKQITDPIPTPSTSCDIKPSVERLDKLKDPQPNSYNTELDFEFRVESKKKLASKERRAKAVALMEAHADAILDPVDKTTHQLLQRQHSESETPGTVEFTVAPNLHVKKAKLLAVHREILRSNSQESVSSNQAFMPNGTCIKEEIEPAEEISNQNNQFHEENFRENDDDDFTKKNNVSSNQNNRNNIELADNGSNEIVTNINDSGKLRNEDKRSSLWSTVESDQVEVIGGRVTVEQKPEQLEAKPKSTIIPLPTVTKTRKKKEKTSHGCPICGFQGKSRIELNKHLSKAHNLIPPFKCNHVEKGIPCNYETAKLQALLNHTDKHSQETIFHCPAKGCTYSTTTIHRLKFHKILHTENHFRCDKCEKKFTHKSSLVTHQLVHETVKNHHCPQCSFSTKYKNHLATHMRIHRGEVLKCSVDPNCHYSTPKKSLLIAHERAHKQERPFKCDLCDKSFVENSALTRHRRIHSDDLPFHCQICTFKTRRKDKLKHHLLKKHSSTAVPSLN